MKYLYQALAQNPSVWALAEVSFVWEGFSNGLLKVEYILGFLVNGYSFLFTLPISEQTEWQYNTTPEQLAKGRLWVYRGFKKRPPNPQTPPNNFVLKTFFTLTSVTIDDLKQRNALRKITVKHNGTGCCLARKHTGQIASGSAGWSLMVVIKCMT